MYYRITYPRDRCSSKHEEDFRQSITKQEWQELVDKYGNKCLCCGSKDNLTKDHVVPQSRGGPSSVDNIQPLCENCNTRKGNKIIDFRVKTK